MAQDTHRTLDQGKAFGEQVRDGLIRPDRLAVLFADLRVVAGDRLCAAGDSDEVRRSGDQREGQPARGDVGAHLTECRRRSHDVRFGPGQVGASANVGQLGRQDLLTRQDQGALSAPSVDDQVVDGYGRSKRVGTDVPREVIGQDRPEKRRVDQSASEFLCDDCHFDAGGPVGTQRPPARRFNLFVQAPNSTLVIEILHRPKAEIVGQLGGGVT